MPISRLIRTFSVEALQKAGIFGILAFSIPFPVYAFRSFVAVPCARFSYSSFLFAVLFGDADLGDFWCGFVGVGVIEPADGCALDDDVLDCMGMLSSARFWLWWFPAVVRRGRLIRVWLAYD